MLTTPLEALLEELNKTSLFSLLTLKLNKQNTCFVAMPNGLNIQFELDKHEKYLVIGCVLGTLESGKYRTAIFKEALKANGLPPPRYGIFAYSIKTKNLVLQDFLDLRELRGEKIAEYLVPFLEKAKLWQEALAGNNIPAPPPESRDKEKLNVFGIKL